MSRLREFATFAMVLGGFVASFLHESLLGGKVLSPGDVVFVQSSFAGIKAADYEPANRLLMDPVLQFQPWLEFSRASIRWGRLPLWNPYVGCGAPHLANDQSAVFDPFHVIAYLGPLPEAHAWMAAARLWTAGLGMFLLARVWGLGAWGRWFAGLTFPFSGFLVVWLFFPSGSVAVWMPWAFLATEGIIRQPSRWRVTGLGLVTALLLFGGHSQTAAHLLLALAGYLAWRVGATRGRPASLRNSIAGWMAGVALGVALAAIHVIPLGVYLTRSPVWGDRLAERRPIASIGRPRVLDAVCTALPYAYGSQRRGHPHLAPVLGVHNLNESAGGFAGLATLIWLAPLAWTVRKRNPVVRYLAGMAVLGALAAFEVPPIANLWRLVPLLNVIDHRRLVLWVAFGLTLLGGIGLDQLRAGPTGRGWQAWASCWVVGSALLLLGAVVVVRLGPGLLPGVIDHYTAKTGTGTALNPDRAIRLAERQIHNLVTFLPAYYAAAAFQALMLWGLFESLRRGVCHGRVARPAVLLITLTDLLAFGLGLNPAIPRSDDRPSSVLFRFLHQEFPAQSRFLAIGGELPPNLMMREGFADCRNYDSIELTRSLDWFEPLYEPDPDRPSRTSRRSIHWSGVLRGLDRLRLAGVVAVVAPSPPPDGAFRRITQVGSVWVACIENPARVPAVSTTGEIHIDVRAGRDDRRVVPVTFTPGWVASVDGRNVSLEPDPDWGAFLSVRIPAGLHRLILRYDPPEVRLALALSALAAIVLVVLPLTQVVTRSHAGKKGPRSWMPSTHRVRIESMTSLWSSHRLPTEGRDADGPLHV